MRKLKIAVIVAGCLLLALGLGFVTQIDLSQGVRGLLPQLNLPWSINGVLNVTRYGNAGDDIATKANAAYHSADCSAYGCSLKFPAGDYVVNTALNFNTPGKTALLLGDAAGTRIFCSWSAPSPCVNLDWGNGVPGQIETLTFTAPGMRDLQVFGPGSPISSISAVGTLVTFTTLRSLGASAGDSVDIFGIAPAAYDGNFTLATANNTTNSYTYNALSSPGAVVRFNDAVLVKHNYVCTALGTANSLNGAMLLGVQFSDCYKSIVPLNGSFNITLAFSGVENSYIGWYGSSLSEEDRILGSNFSGSKYGVQLTSGTVQLAIDSTSFDEDDSALDIDGGGRVTCRDCHFENPGGKDLKVITTPNSGSGASNVFLEEGDAEEDLFSSSGAASAPLIDESGFRILVVNNFGVASAGRSYSAQGIIKSTGTGSGVYATIDNINPTAFPVECMGCTARYFSMQSRGDLAISPMNLSNLSLSIGGGVPISDSNKLSRYVGGYSFSSGTSQTLSVTGLSSSSNCFFQATNATGAALTGVYPSAATGTLTLHSSAPSSTATFSAYCSL